MKTARLKNDEICPCPQTQQEGWHDEGWPQARGLEIVIVAEGTEERLHSEDRCGAKKYYRIRPLLKATKANNIPPEDFDRLCVCDHLIEPHSFYDSEALQN